MRRPARARRAASRPRGWRRHAADRAARRCSARRRAGSAGCRRSRVGMAFRRGMAPSIWLQPLALDRRCRGWRPSGPAVYGCAGWLITSCTGPISAMRPAYITATRSQVSAITPMSCVISMTAAPRSLQMRLSSWMICAWIDTSSAVVGSSATISLGSAASASAITTRWRMPPENWCGIVVDALGRGRDAGVFQQADGAPARLVVVDRQVRLDGLGQLPADGVQRIERRQRVLEDRADLAAADMAHLLVRQVVDALAFQQDLAATRRARAARAGR